MAQEEDGGGILFATWMRKVKRPVRAFPVSVLKRVASRKRKAQKLLWVRGLQLQDLIGLIQFIALSCKCNLITSAVGTSSAPQHPCLLEPAGPT